MSLAPIPTKTPLGQDALRRRTGELGQRHRTILFLIDGRRTLMCGSNNYFGLSFHPEVIAAAVSGRPDSDADLFTY